MVILCNAGTIVRYRIKGTQTDAKILRYRIEISDAGITMPASSASMPMPRYESYVEEYIHKQWRIEDE